MLYPIELWVLTEENFKFSPQITELFLYCFSILFAREQNRIEARSAMANDYTGKSCPQYSVWKLLCQSPVEGQVDLEVVENRPACGGKTAPGRLS
jgi:hypothetical protein